APSLWTDHRSSPCRVTAWEHKPASRAPPANDAPVERLSGLWTSAPIRERHLAVSNPFEFPSNALLISYIILTIYLVWRSSRLSLRFAEQNPIFGVIVALLLALVFGIVGSGYGISDLFWHEDNWTQFGAGASAAMLVALLFLWGFLLGDDADRAYLYKLSKW